MCRQKIRGISVVSIIYFGIFNSELMYIRIIILYISKFDLRKIEISRLTYNCLLFEIIWK